MALRLVSSLQNPRNLLKLASWKVTCMVSPNMSRDGAGLKDPKMSSTWNLFSSPSLPSSLPTPCLPHSPLLPTPTVSVLALGLTVSCNCLVPSSQFEDTWTWPKMTSGFHHPGLVNREERNRERPTGDVSVRFYELWLAWLRWSSYLWANHQSGRWETCDQTGPSHISLSVLHNRHLSKSSRQGKAWKKEALQRKRKC